MLKLNLIVNSKCFKRFYISVEKPWLGNTGCPLIDPKLIDEIVTFINNDFDYVSNTLKPSYPGLDIEIFKSKFKCCL